MDYDRNDALLHWLFRQTQGDAWFRPNEENISSGVALRINDSPEFRVFPYENVALEPFEAAVSVLNPVVAVKVRSAAVHAALAEIGPEDKSIYVDANTRIQVMDTMLLLPNADKEQCAAFIRDERVMVIWSDSLDNIIPTCRDIEERLIRLLWRSRPGIPPSSTAGTTSVMSDSAASLDSHAHVLGTGASAQFSEIRKSTTRGNDPPPGVNDPDATFSDSEKKAKKRTWYGGKRDSAITTGDLDRGFENEKAAKEGSDSQSTIEEGIALGSRKPRKALFYAPIYNGLAAGLAFFFIGNALKTILEEWSLDGNFLHFVLIVTLPFLFCVSLFFALQIIQNVTMALGPIAHFYENSKYYSAIRPAANKVVDEALPHITIQMPVYKESLHATLAPSIESIKKAMQTYARQGGTSSIFINDDGLRLISPAERDERISYYANHNIGWVARPKQEDGPNGFKRAGRFKKASNMNYGLDLSLRLEKHLDTLLVEGNVPGSGNGFGGGNAGRISTSSQIPGGAGSIINGQRGRNAFSNGNLRDRGDLAVNGGSHGIEEQERSTPSPNPNTTSDGASAGPDFSLASSHAPVPGANNAAFSANPLLSFVPGAGGNRDDLEERALSMAVEELFEESGKRWRPWAANARSMRVGEIVLIVDSDTVVPEDCLRDAAREMKEDPSVGIIQHESDVLQIAHHYFENGIAYFTRRVNRCISMACANGEVAPFMGHNAFLRWRALQDAAFVDPADGKEKIWSESNVSEDFDMALRLMLKGYIIRWATYSNGGFKEGVSLSVDDELNRWQKYAYGCSELLFNPFVTWWRKGPINHQIHKFMWSKAPLHYKISMMAYMFSYYGIAASMTISLINYLLLGFQLPVDGMYLRSFEIWLATTVVFFGSGNLGYTLLEYRLGHKQLLGGFVENIMWIPFFFFFFGGLSIPVSQAMLAHLFSYNITWSATIKEVERSNIFKEIPKIAKRFWFPLCVSFAVIVMIIVLSTELVPYAWRIDSTAWAVIFPLAVGAGCHILFPIILNPWLMVFSY
ncbi:hypothetical protein AX16_000801 [Volvariella volvacea WC 439]|nr:hypothetical protein AX16_000801 [Volvariella volvacea WC 439]